MFFQKNDNFSLLNLHFRVSLHKICCARQSESNFHCTHLQYLCIRYAALGNLKVNFHCTHLQYLCIKIVRYENN